jgi:hypothetical protein
MPDTPNLPDQLTFTLPRQQWSLIVWLAGRGALETLDQFIKKGVHTIDCITEHANAVKALQDLYKAVVPEPEKTAAKDTLASEEPSA